MDPLSVTASVVGILGGIATVAEKVSTLKQNYNYAELYITQTASLLFSVQRALEALDRLRNSEALATSPTGLQLDQDLTLPLESCAVLIALIERQLQGIDIENPSKIEKMRFLGLKETFMQAERSLGTQVTALQLLISIYQCGTLAERTKPLNRQNTQRALRDVMDHTASLALEDKDIDDAASILSKDPSVHFTFDHEILQTKQYKAVYKDLYLRYKPASIKSSVFSPRVSTLLTNDIETPTEDMPPLPPRLDQTKSDGLPVGQEAAERPESFNLQPKRASRLETVTEATSTQTLSPPPNKPRHTRQRSTSSVRSRPDPLIGNLPQLPFLGIPFQGESETNLSISSDEEVEENAAKTTSSGDEVSPGKGNGHVDDQAGTAGPDSTLTAIPQERSDASDLHRPAQTDSTIQMTLAAHDTLARERVSIDANRSPTLGSKPLENLPQILEPNPANTARPFYNFDADDSGSDLYGVSDDEEQTTKPNASPSVENEESCAIDTNAVTSDGLQERDPPGKSIRNDGSGPEVAPSSREELSDDVETSDADELKRIMGAIKTARQNQQLSESRVQSPNLSVSSSKSPQLPQITPLFDSHASPLEIDFGQQPGLGLSMPEMIKVEEKENKVSNVTQPDTPSRLPPPVPPRPRSRLETAHGEAKAATLTTKPAEETAAAALLQAADHKVPDASKESAGTNNLSHTASAITDAVFDSGSPSVGASPRRRVPPPPPPPRKAPKPPTVPLLDKTPSESSRAVTHDPRSDPIVASPVENVSNRSSPRIEPAKRVATNASSPQPIFSDNASSASISIAPSRDSTSMFNDNASVGAQTADTTLLSIPTSRAYEDTVATIDTSSTGGLVPLGGSDQAQKKSSLLRTLQRSKGSNDLGQKTRVRPKASMPRLSFFGSDSSSKARIFHEAAAAGNLTVIQECLREKTKLVNSMEKLDGDREAKTAMMRAAAGNHVSCVELLALSGADYGLADKESKIAMHYAVENQAVKCVQFFAERFQAATAPTGQTNHVSPLEISGPLGLRPLHMAAATGNIDMMNILIRMGAQSDSRDGAGRTPLNSALKGMHLAAFQRLLDCGADVRVVDYSKRTVLMWAAEANAQKAVERLLELGLDRNAKDSEGNQAVHIAAEKGHVTILEMLYLRIADFEVENSRGERPLHLAAGAGQARATKALLKVGCTPLCYTTGDRRANSRKKVTSRKEYASTPLHYACAAGADNVVESLIYDGCNGDAGVSAAKLVNANQEDGMSPLMLAAQAKCFAATRVLLENGADPKAQTATEKLTALHFAARADDLESAQLLYRNGADTKARNKKMQTAYNYGSEDGKHPNDTTRWLSKQNLIEMRRARVAQDDGYIEQQRQNEANAQAQALAQYQAAVGYGLGAPPPGTLPAPGGQLIWVPYAQAPGMVAAAQPVPRNANSTMPLSYFQSSTRTDEGVEPPPAYSPRQNNNR